MTTLVIDTSYGSTLGIVGQEPIIEPDSRTHVELLRTNIERACEQAAVTPAQVDTIIVGTGPAPFTGLRVGLVSAKAMAYANGAQLLGQDCLTGQCQLMREAHAGNEDILAHLTLAQPPAGSDAEHTRYLTLSLNDARRKQLYFTLFMDADSDEGNPVTLIDMDIDSPANIVERVNKAVHELAQAHPELTYVVDVCGHGADKYAQAWESLEHKGSVNALSTLDCGTAGLELFAGNAIKDPDSHRAPAALEPLYLRRPDVSVPNPLKHVLNHEGATRA